MKSFHAILLLTLAAILGGCRINGRGTSLIGEAWRNTFGETAWAYGAELGEAEVFSAEKRTRENGLLNGKFRGSVDCWTAAFELPFASGGKMRGQAILPIDWNGTLWLVANDSPDGELPARAVAFAQDGSAVVCGDGGMGQVRRRNGRLNPMAAGARSPALRKAFFQDALKPLLDCGKALVERKYGRAPDAVSCYGRESGGAQALFLVAQDPSAVSKLVLVNPAVDFAACAAYDLNIARFAERGSSMSHLVRPLQFVNLQRGAKDLNLPAFDLAKTNELWSAAGKYDDSFSYNMNLVPIICSAWTHLLAPPPLTDGTNSIAIPPVRLDMEFDARMRERSWRLAWLLSNEEYDPDVSNEDFFAHLPEAALYTPPIDLAPYFAAGGQVELTLEPANARVPSSVAQSLVEKNPSIGR